jgi:mRNA-degrading endonuclease RelE of RelBE toxin-antitoxin system
MSWTVTFHRKVDKSLDRLPAAVQKHLFRLVYEIELLGPVRGNWTNYSKLDGNRHHCHLKIGRPTYVAVWTEDKENITVEVVYAGTHENAPYG